MHLFRDGIYIRLFFFQQLRLALGLLVGLDWKTTLNVNLSIADPWIIQAS
jgi:hypothetical protein